MDVLPGVPTVDQPVQQISFSHEAKASLPRRYGQPPPQSRLRRNLSIHLAREISDRAVIPPEPGRSSKGAVHTF